VASYETPDIVEELLKLTPGRVKAFLGADFDGVRQRLEAEAPALRRPIVLLKRIDADEGRNQM